MNFDTLAKETFHVGREQQGAPAAHAFDIVRRDDGGISLRDVKQLSDRERTMLMQHFGRPITARTGSSSSEHAWDGEETRQPGSPAHFVAAVYRLPAPFILIPSKG